MKKFTTIASALFFALSTTAQQNVSKTVMTDINYMFHGKTDANVSSVNVYSSDDNELLGRFSVRNGEYFFGGHVDAPMAVVVANDNRNVLGQYIIEPGCIQSVSPFLATGGELNDAFVAIVDSITRMGQKVRSGALGMEEYEQMLIAYDRSVFAQHSNDLVGVRIIDNCLDSEAVKLELYQKGGDVVKNSRVFSPEVVESWKTAARTAEGQMFVDFAVEYNGKVTKLSDYVGHGKYVLVDFWASWCGPCKAEIPNIINVYNKYKGDKFEVLGVAAWDEPQDTQKAVEAMGIPYPQILNSMRIATDAYSIRGVPQIILFGPDGKIVKRNLRGEMIENIVRQYLEK